MHKFEVGGYFYGKPQPLSQEGLVFDFDTVGGTLVVSLPGLTHKEAEKIRTGKIEFALFEKEGIMFLLAKIPGVFDWSDAPFHIGLYSKEVPIPSFVDDGKGLSLMLIGADTKNGLIKAVRLIGLGTKFSREMINIMDKQKLSRTNPVYNNNKIKCIYKEYSCEVMVSRAIATYGVRRIEND